MTKLEAVKKALKAYEKALAELEAVPPRTREAAIFTEEHNVYTQRSNFICSECSTVETFALRPNWKFCPHCGAEIIRFDKVEKVEVFEHDGRRYQAVKF